MKLEKGESEVEQVLEQADRNTSQQLSILSLFFNKQGV